MGWKGGSGVVIAAGKQVRCCRLGIGAFLRRRIDQAESFRWEDLI